MNKTLLNYVQSIFSDDSGNDSSLRFLIAIVIIVIFFNWTFFNIKNNVFSDLSSDMMIFIFSLFGTKVFQKKYENKNINAEELKKELEDVDRKIKC